MMRNLLLVMTAMLLTCCSSESDVNYAYGMHLYFGIAFVENLGLFVKNDGFSVRCIKDSE